jgi:LPS-assembly lipoprotein
MASDDTRRSRRGLLAAAASTLLLAGCGFQMRGVAAPPFKTLYIGFPPGSTSAAEFKRLLRGSSTVIVDQPQAAEARLAVLQELREKEIVGFSVGGRPREFQLRLLMTFRLTNAQEEELIPATQLTVRREITTTDTQYVAKEQEEALMYRDMQRDMLEQLLRRLSAVRG